MTRQLCQVCAQPASRDADGILWIISENPHRPDTWTDPLVTTHPPICAPCASRSAQLCPHLRRDSATTVLRVRDFEIAGVHGALYYPGIPEPVKVGVAFYGEPASRWVRAGQLAACLTDYTIATIPAYDQSPDDPSIGSNSHMVEHVRVSLSR